MDLKELLKQYSQALSDSRAFWDIVAFEHSEWPWEDESTLARVLDGMRSLVDPVWPYEPSEASEFPPPFWLTQGIKGRKLAQVQAFIAQVPNQLAIATEWCAGKGHLGRLLSFTQQRPVVSIEWQSALCAEGAELARHHQLPQTFIQQDVLATTDDGKIQQTLRNSQTAMALHACGDLHIRLLEHATEAQVRDIFVAPCCYHLTRQAYYEPLSKIAQACDFRLSKNALRLAAQGLVTAGRRERGLRQTELVWRLSYESWRQDQLSDPCYRPLNSVSKAIFAGPFEDFCRWAAAQHGMSLDLSFDAEYWLAIGKQRFLVTEAIEQVRLKFQPYIERWLLLDRAVFLQEQGYEVSLKAFCERELTPRNTLISARARV
ncbi:hypothetical protein BFR57_07535 [Idiomarina sp. MD25a]|uniref:methyltransferase n=1 Tax=Idiomarina sp. MD25a TaxID=1889913 RepID=UPI0008F96166|nr:methyltransferase [Idiomarina sp. MD25a]OIN01899.1 hypothetical protein BFR57_07535 [Idiomarina sp. MD25a]